MNVFCYIILVVYQSTNYIFSHPTTLPVISSSQSVPDILSLHFLLEMNLYNNQLDIIKFNATLWILKCLNLHDQYSAMKRSLLNTAVSGAKKRLRDMEYQPCITVAI